MILCLVTTSGKLKQLCGYVYLLSNRKGSHNIMYNISRGKKSTPDFMVYGESGRYPLEIQSNYE